MEDALTRGRVAAITEQRKRSTQQGRDMPAPTDVFPAQDAKAITPNDTADAKSPVYRALYVGVSGDITLRTSAYASPVLLKSVPVGVLPINCQWVYATGTAATSLVGLV